MGRIRLLLVNYEYPPLGGGAATATACLAREFNRLDADVSIVTSAFADLPRKDNRDGIEIVRVRALRRSAEQSNPLEMITFMISASLHALRFARKWKPDASIAFFGIPGGPVSLVLRWIHAIPYIVSLRGGDVPGHQREQLAGYHRMTRRLITFIWRRAHDVVANSTGLREQAMKAAPDVNISLIANGVDAERFDPCNIARKSDEKSARILFVGRVSYEKGLQYLLPALSKLESDWRFTIVGQGPYTDEIEAMSKTLGLEAKIEWTGWAARERLPQLYGDADIFVFPSTDEGMPNTVLEAMASGLPVIATRIPGVEDLIEDGRNGILVPPADTIALQHALASVLHDKARRAALGKAARHHVMEAFTWRKSAERYMSLVKEAIWEAKGPD
jgi:glycosyltransferase involved in cell wall biosynthesis